MNLVMIGRFKEVRDAEEARRLIESLVERVSTDSEAYSYDSPPQYRRFSEAMLKFLVASNLATFHPAELGQFMYDVSVKGSGNEVVLTTDESDVSVFLKVLLEKGARIEIYSAHDYPDTEHGR
jgi:hypothetical protein